MKKIRDSSGRGSPFESFFHLRGAEPQAFEAINDLRLDGTIEELGVGVLKQEACTAEDLVDRVLPGIEIVNGDRSDEFSSVEVGDEANSRTTETRFSASARSRHEHSFAGGNGQVKVLEGPGVASCITVRDFFET
jgi:hypothetical protein